MKYGITLLMYTPITVILYLKIERYQTLPAWPFMYQEFKVHAQQTIFICLNTYKHFITLYSFVESFKLLLYY